MMWSVGCVFEAGCLGCGTFSKKALDGEKWVGNG